MSAKRVSFFFAIVWFALAAFWARHGHPHVMVFAIIVGLLNLLVCLKFIGGRKNGNGTRAR